MGSPKSDSFLGKRSGSETKETLSGARGRLSETCRDEGVG